MQGYTQDQIAAIQHLNEWRVGALFMEPVYEDEPKDEEQL
jgi:uncharacterized protein YpbB